MAGMLILLPAAPFAGDGWEKTAEDEEKNIVVYTRSVADAPLKAFRGETTLSASLGSLVRICEDADAYPEWMYSVKSAKVLEIINERERITYSRQDTTWPLTDRDLVAYSKIEQDPETKAVTIHMEARPDAYPEQEGHVRVPEGEGKWQFTPKGDGKVAVVYQAHVDPGGCIPAAIASSYAVDTPMETLRGLHEMVEKPEYQDATVDFITEP